MRSGEEVLAAARAFGELTDDGRNLYAGWATIHGEANTDRYPVALGPPAPQRWWMETALLSTGRPYGTLVAEVLPYWLVRQFRHPEPHQQANIGLESERTAVWLDQLWEGPLPPSVLPKPPGGRSRARGKSTRGTTRVVVEGERL
jgi:hypothetical protein